MLLEAERMLFFIKSVWKCLDIRAESLSWHYEKKLHADCSGHIASDALFKRCARANKIAATLTERKGLIKTKQWICGWGMWLQERNFFHNTMLSLVHRCPTVVKRTKPFEVISWNTHCCLFERWINFKMFTSFLFETRESGMILNVIRPPANAFRTHSG